MPATLNGFEKRSSAHGGTYFRSTKGRKELLGALRKAASAPGRFKLAEEAGDEEQGFEQAFSSLAYTYVKEKSPRLLDFIVGFQLVDRNEDKTKAMGVFGFKVGEQWLYAPVFFLSGDLKGHELLYIKKQDAFVPMKENWVNYLISRKPHTLGESSSKNTYELGGMLPDFSRFTHPPSSSKYGSDGASLRPDMQEWAKDFLPFYAAAGVKSARALFPMVKDAAAKLAFDEVIANPFKAAFAETAANFDLRKFLSQDFRLLKMAYDFYYTKYPWIKKGFDQFYGEDFFFKTAQAIKQAQDSIVVTTQTRLDRNTKQASAPAPKRTDSPFLFEPPPPKPHPNANGGLEVIALDVSVDAEGGFTKNLPELTDEERAKLLKDTVLIKDKRDPHAKSMVYDTQVRLELTNPTETGLYKVLEKPGTFDEMLVIAHPQSGRGRERFALVIRKSDPRAWLNTHSTNLWAKKIEERDEFKKWFDGLSGTDSLKKNGVYVAIGENGSATCPFRIREDYGEGSYRVEWKDHCRYGSDRPSFLKRPREWDWCENDFDSDYSSWDAKIYINKRKGCSLKSVNGELSIPEDYKIFKIQDPPPPPKKGDKDYELGCFPGDCGPIDSESETRPVEPGNLADVQLLLHKQSSDLGLTHLSVQDTGANEVWIKSRGRSERMSKKAAFIALVRDHGLDQVQVREVMTKAAAMTPYREAAKFFVKYAYGYGDTNLQPGPDAPQFPVPPIGMENAGPNAYPAQYSDEQFLPVVGMQANMSDAQIYDPFYQPDRNTMQVAQQASQSGQKEVFDTAMISGMLKSVNQNSLVDRHLGDLMKALDKLGRIIFMFYWHQEEFEDRYGKQDLPELEDSLRNAFDTLGDVTLYLKEKQVGGGSIDGMAGQSNGTNNAEPDVEEAARN